MLRTIVWFIYLWGYMLFLIPSYFKANALVKAGHQEEVDRYTAKIAGLWSKRLLAVAGCRVRTTFISPLPEAPFLLVSNHQGNFDIPLIMAHVSSRVGFFAKAETRRLPLIGRWMEMIHCVFIDRGNPREAVKSIQEGVETLKKGYNLVLYPEGTRSIDGTLLPFKAGSLKMALKAGVPVIPVVIDGSINMMQKGSYIIRPADVHITIGNAIDPAEYATTQALTEALEGYMESVLSAGVRGR